MKLGITSKLFLGLLGTSIVVALAMGLAMHVSFVRGFLGYLNQQELQRVEMLLPKLEAAYREHGDWEFLRSEPRAWFGLLRSADPRESNAEPRPPLPDVDLTGINLRLALLDTERQRVAGVPRALEGATLRPVEVAGSVVGYLAVLPFQRASTAAAVEFEQRQLKSIWIIGGLSVLLAALVAVALARLLLAPVKRIAHATRRLAAGDYGNRIEVESRDELGQLAEDFNRLALSLEKNEQLRRAFMADVSHELRTPLAVLRGELEAIEDGVRPLSQASVKSLQAEVATLGKLVGDLYDLSLSDVGALTYRKQDVDVRESIEAALGAYAERLAAQRIELEVALGAAPLMLLADPERLRQLFNNLMENVIRYTDPGGRLRIGARRQNGDITIDFQDTEPGVPEALLPRLFERLYRVEASRNRASGGAGLGLAICRNIVEAHDGSIDARTSPLGGLWIALRFPAAHG